MDFPALNVAQSPHLHALALLKQRAESPPLNPHPRFPRAHSERRQHRRLLLPCQSPTDHCTAPPSCEFSKTSFNTRMPHVWSSVCLPVQITSISSVKRQETLSGARRSSNLCPTLPRIFCKFSIFSFAASMLSITFACSVPSTGSRSHCI